MEITLEKQIIHIQFEKWPLGRLGKRRIIMTSISEMKMWIKFPQLVTDKSSDTATRDLVVSTNYLRLLIAICGLKLEDGGCSLPECTTLIFKFFCSHRIFTKLFMSFLSSQVKASKSRFCMALSTYFALDEFVMLIWNRKDHIYTKTRRGTSQPKKQYQSFCTLSTHRIIKSMATMFRHLTYSKSM
jgi:hypothetical protein